ncbi:hypothetical protein, partial [Cupriavidus necator]|uniref:hypothetical protein n=1 Tax=Cupriavidus necator TaxID=106590 RepID=UPI0030F488BE
SRGRLRLLRRLKVPCRFFLRLRGVQPKALMRYRQAPKKQPHTAAALETITGTETLKAPTRAWQ